MRHVVPLLVTALSFAVAPEALAACKKPFGKYAGSYSEKQYSRSTKALTNSMNGVMSVTFNADGSGNFTLRQMASLGGTATVTTTGSFTAANHTFTAATCSGFIGSAFGSPVRPMYYNASRDGTVLTYVLDSGGSHGFSDTSGRLELQ